MKRLYRKITFLVKWKATIDTAEGYGSVMNYPLLMILTFNREQIRESYLASGDYEQVLTDFIEHQNKLAARRIYKNNRRKEMQKTVGFSYETWQARVERWRDHIEISEAIKNQENHDKENTGS